MCLLYKGNYYGGMALCKIRNIDYSAIQISKASADRAGLPDTQFIPLKFFGV